MGKFYETFKKQIISMLPELFQRKEKERKLPSSFNEVLLTWITKLNKHNVRKKYYSSLLFMNIHVRILDKILANSIVF